MTFFVCEAKLAKELANGIRMRLNTRCVHQGGSELGHRDISILREELREKGAVWVKLAFTSRAPLRGWESPTCSPDCKRPTGPVLAHLVTASIAKPQPVRSNPPQCIAETAPEVHLAKVLT